MKTKTIKIACFQTNSSEEALQNMTVLDDLFKSLSNEQVDMVFLPECVAIFTDSKKKLEVFFKNIYQRFIDFFSYQAKNNNIYIFVGSIPYKKANGKFLNRSIIFDKKGKIIEIYDKINLFDVYLNKNEYYLESKNYDSGNSLKIVKAHNFSIGLSICYDLRFPLMYRKLTKKGAKCFFIPAAFTYTTGKAHWHSLLRARAIENGCYVFAPAQCGVHQNGRKTFGHSLIIDPWGVILKEAPDGVNIISAEINISDIVDVRKKIPSITKFDF